MNNTKKLGTLENGFVKRLSDISSLHNVNYPEKYWISYTAFVWADFIYDKIRQVNDFRERN